MIHESIIELIREAKQINIYTGAGMSTEGEDGSKDGGIPDFRSKSGLYQHAPETILFLDFFFNHPEKFYDFFFQSLYHPTVKPNKGHRILAEWEKKGKDIHIVTQNIDGLHSAAGSKNIIEFHGTVKTATCYNPKCQRQYTVDELLLRRQDMKHFYICDCGKSSTKRYIKPDVVLYDEKGKWMSNKHISTIRQNNWRADVIMVLGTSLRVYPFRSFIDNKPPQIPLIIINEERLSQESLPNTYAIHRSISKTLSEIDQYI